MTHVTSAARDRLEGVKAKAERAKHHVNELDTALRAFFGTNPYAVGTKRDPQTRKLIYYLVSVRDVPREISVIAGEVLQSLRSALDHLAYQLVVAGSGLPGPFYHVYFPIFDSASKYEAGKLGQIKGMRQDAITAIDAIKPYAGGNDTLWRLHKLNNVDKHRLLVTVGSQMRSADLGAFMSSQMPPLPDGTPVPILSAFFKVADRMFPLKAGDELFIDLPDAEPNEHLKFKFEVALSEPQILEGEPILETLHEMIDLVDHLIPIFKPLL
jgi:hypothetical protein